MPDACDVEMVILEQPDGIDICEGADGMLSVTAVNPATATYQWAKDGVPLADNAYLTGTDTDTLYITAVDSARDEGDYTCFVADGCLEFESTPATLSALGYPTIVTQPADPLEGCLGTNRSMSVVATGTGAVLPVVSQRRSSSVRRPVLRNGNVVHDDQRYSLRRRTG